MLNSVLINRLLIGICLLILVACGNAQKSIPKEPTMPDVVIGPANTHRLEALSAELDPHFFAQNITRNDGAKAADWHWVVDRVKKMNLRKIRVMVLPQWFEPINDNDDPHTTDWSAFTFESVEMQSLYQVLDLAQKEAMDVCIVLWGCPVYVNLIDPDYSHVKTCFMADASKKGIWITGPTDYDEWAECFSALVNHLLNEKGYTCVNEITPMNEPDGGPLLDEIEYVKMSKVLHERFVKDGLRGQVRFNLSDNTDTRTFYLEYCAEHLRDEADLLNSHTYIFGYDTPNSEIVAWERNNVRIAADAGKKHVVGEFGSNQCVGATRQKDIDRYERGVLMSRLVLNFLNAGASGVSYWSLIDQYYGRDESYEQMQQLGMWKYIKEAYKPDSMLYNTIKADYEVRPQYYAYTLLTRFLTPDSKVYPIEMAHEFVTGTVFEDVQGKWTYVFVNGSEEEERLKLTQLSDKKVFDLYIYADDLLPEGDCLIEAKEKVTPKDGSFLITLRPQTVLLYRER